MNTPKMNYAAVGGFVVIILIALMAVITTLTGQTGATDPYFTVYKNVTGVKFGTQVLYEGYPVGQVEEVKPEAVNGAMMFRVDFEVTEGWQIPNDSVARIGSSGLLSAITINLDAGVSPAPYKPGSKIVGRESADMFAVLSDMAGEVSEIAENDIRPMLKTIKEAAESFNTTIQTVGVLVEEDGKRMIKDFGIMADDLSKRVPKITANLDAGTADFAILAKDLQETRAKLDELLVSTNGMVGENRDAVQESIKDVQHVADSLARHVDAVNQNLEGTARNMYEFSREIRQNPGLLLSSSPPEEGAGTR